MEKVKGNGGRSDFIKCNLIDYLNYLNSKQVLLGRKGS